MTKAISPVELRPYQKECLQRLADVMVRKPTVKRGLVVLPTAAGKTVTLAYFAAALVKKLGLRIVWTAHREELLTQAREAFTGCPEKNFAGIAPDLHVTRWDADTKDASGQVVLVSIQSSKGLPEALESLYGAQCKSFVSVTDEAHHFAKEEIGKKGGNKYSNTYVKFNKQLEDTGIVNMWIGMTATATRLDTRILNFDQIVYQRTFMDLVRQGWLAMPKYHEMRTLQAFHLDEIEKESEGGKRDYTDKDLQRLNNEVRNRRIAEEYVKKKDQWGKTLMFAVNVPHAYKLGEEIKKIDPSIPVRVIDGKASDMERTDFRKWFSEGDTSTVKVAINCLLYTEGVDEPTINTVFLTRPTKSKGLWMQMVGRGARIVRDATGKITKTKFHLVNVMDEIGHYGTLVEEWILGITDDGDADDLKRRRNHKKKARIKRRLIAKIEEMLQVPSIEMDEARELDVQAVLTVTTKWCPPAGIAMTRDRLDCIRLLREFVNDGLRSNNFDPTSLNRSYSSCVQANEFPPKAWRDIAWAYFFRYIKNQEKIRCDKTGRWEAPWRLISIVPKDEIEGEQAMSEAEARLKDIRENARKKNEEFNLKYGSREETEKLYKLVMDGLSIENNRKGQAELVRSHTVRVTAKDRVLEVRTDLKVHDKSKFELSAIGYANEEGSSILRKALDDSVMEFRVIPAPRST